MLPWIGTCYWRWREDQVWQAYESAKSKRDESLARWRIAYEKMIVADAKSSVEESANRESYLTLRREAEARREELETFYRNPASRWFEAMLGKRNGVIVFGK
jgi:hypothetical protein